MNVRQFFLFASLGAVATMTSCNNDEETINEPMPVQFTSSVAGLSTDKAVTKAADTSWGAGDAIGIYMVAAGTSTISEGAENRRYTTATGSSSFSAATPADAIYYPVDGSQVDFIAYYPHTAGLTGFVYNVDVRVQTSQPAIDLLYCNAARGKSKTDTNVALAFNHQLVKLILTTKPGLGLTDADLKGMGISIEGMNTVCTFDLTTGTLGTAGTPALITPFTAINGEKYEAIVLPSTVVNGGDVRVKFTIAGGDTFVWLVPAATIFGGGTKNTFDITITRTGVSVTGTIHPWTDGVNGIGIAD